MKEKVKFSNAAFLVTLIAFTAVLVLTFRPMPAPAHAAAPAYVLEAAEADLSKAPNVILEPDDPPFNLGGWHKRAKVIFHINVEEAGDYNITLLYSKPESDGDPADLKITVGGEDSFSAPLPPTGEDWSNYEEYEFCTLRFPAGKTTLTLESARPRSGNYVMNLRSVTLSAGFDPVETSGGGVLSLDQDDIMNRWIGDGVRADVSGSQVFIYFEGEDSEITPYGYEWKENKTEFELTPDLMKYQGRPLAVMKFIQGEKLVLEIEGTYPEDPKDGAEDKLIPISISLLRIEDAGVKVCPTYADVFDWGPADQKQKEKIAGTIIAAWKKYDENADAEFFNARNLAGAIDNYDGDIEQRLIFDIACEIAGVDAGSYHYE